MSFKTSISPGAPPRKPIPQKEGLKQEAAKEAQDLDKRLESQFHKKKD